MRLIKIFVILLVLPFITGCAGSKVIEYKYSLLDDPEQAKKVITQVILEQPPGIAPASVDITNEFIQIKRFRTKTKWHGVGVATVPYTETLFFNNIKSAEMYTGRDYIRILIKENSGHVKWRVMTWEEKKGQLFIDALKTLEKDYFARNSVK